MTTRTMFRSLLATLLLASCMTTSESTQAGSETDDEGSGAGEGCIEGNCEETVACEQPASVGDVEPIKALSEHDPANEGQRCLDCHDAAAHAANERQPVFDFGGRVVDPSTGQGRANAIVRMPSTEGFIAVPTNSLGYFWWPPAEYGGSGGNSGPGEITNRAVFPAPVGVEVEGELRMMCAEAANGNCASCHDGTTTAQIF